MKILVLSDTHIPRTAPDLPAEVYDALEGADMIFHAGDFVERELLEKLKGLKEVKAVYGNMDSRSVRDLLNAKETISIGRLKVGLIHGYGAPNELIDTIKSEFAGVNAIVFGHSHSPVNIVKDGILFFNPGSPTDKVFAAYNSYGILEVTDRKIEGKIIRL